MNLIPYSRQWIDEEDIRSVLNILKSDIITQGTKIQEFEEKLAEYCGAQYCVVFNSGTSALHGAYFTFGLKEKDEFITSPITFVATSNAGLYLNARPVFVDIEKDTGNIDITKIEAKISDKTKLFVPVHYAGNPVDMEKIFNLSKKYNIPVIEDACHALGARYKEDKTGSCRFSDMTVFSFHPVKHITTGEGGAVLTNSADYHKKLLMFREHGITKKEFVNDSPGGWYYEMHFLGYNYRLTDIQAALGISQLNKLDEFLEKRREIARVYHEAFKDNPYFDAPLEKDYAFSSYHLYPIRLKGQYRDKKKFMFNKLRERGLGVQVHYIPIYWQPYYQNLGYKKGLCPEAEDFYRREISIPIYPAMTDSEINYVIETLHDTLKVSQ
jgi:UDP-4-amino-4,6-dideoxy-N-acetyl-beta-L-altrosamine transaminase